MNGNSIRIRVFGIVLIIILCIGLTFKFFQNDTFYMIKLGDYIVHHGLDGMDHFSWIKDLSYTCPHWLYDIFIYYVYYFFGFFGVYVSVIISSMILSIIIYSVSLKIIKNEFLALLVAVVSVFRLSAFVVARAQVISLSLFILEVYFIHKLIESGKNKYIFYLVLLSLLIANIHGTAWLFYFVLFMPFIGEYIFYKFIHIKKVRKLYHLDKYKNGRIIVENIKNIKKVFIGFGLAFCMGLLTPSRICYSYVFRIMMGNSQNVLLEHFPVVPIEEPFFMILLFLFVISLIFTNVNIKLREIFMIIGLMFLSLISGRHLSFFYSIGFIYIALICYRALTSIGDNSFDILGNIIINNRVYMLVILVIVIVISGNQFIRHSKEDYVLKKIYPVDAVKYIKENLEYKDIRLFNEYNYGSYLLFNDIPVFIDSRCDLYLKEFNGMKYSIFDELADISVKYEKKFKKYGVTHVLLSKNNSFYMTLIKDNNYNTIYKDKYFMLFERVG